MTQPLFSASWYRVEGLRPALRGHVRIRRQSYRGETWFLLQDPANEQFLRLTPEAYAIVAGMRGEETVGTLWGRATGELGERAPAQEELVQLLGQLHAADLIRCDVTPDAAELFERGSRQNRRQLLGRLLNPLSIQVHLWNPDRLLGRCAKRLGPALGIAGAVAWCVVVLPAVVLALRHWNDLSQNWVDQLFSANHLAATWAVFAVLKTFHELGHGLLAKRFGGHVYSVGITLLVFVPVPYVDASSSWAFPDKKQRALVASAGMIFELLLAAIAFYIWINAEPGLLRATAYSAVMVGGISTLLFNANPLMRFDGYYILSDLMELPNLRSRANQAMLHVAGRRLLGDRETPPPGAAPGETKWLITFWTAALVYRFIVTIAILTWLINQSIFLGTVLGLAAAAMWVVTPAMKAFRYLQAQRLRGRTGEVVLTRSAAAAGVVFAFFALLPLPERTVAEGVVWLPEDAFVRAGTSAFVNDLKARPGERVTAGDLLVSLADPVKTSEVEQRSAHVTELDGRRRLEMTRDAVAVRVSEEELINAHQQLAFAEDEERRLELRAGRNGVFVVPAPGDLPGRFLKKGTLVGYVLEPGVLSVRAVVPQHDIALVRDQSRGAAVRVAGRMGESLAATLLRIHPAAESELPSNVLTSIGGGKITADPREPEGRKALGKLFEVELSLPAALQDTPPGTRVFVRFHHGYAPLVMQLYRSIQQTFLTQFAG